MKGIVVLLGFVSLLNGPLRAQVLPKPTTRSQGRLTYQRSVKPSWKVTPSASLLTPSERMVVKARTANALRLANDTKNAEKAYAELVAEGASSPDYPLYHLYYAQALASNGKFGEARAIYAAYEELLEKTGLATATVESNNAQPVLIGDGAGYTVERLALNTQYADFSPTLYRDGLVFVSTRGKHRKGLLAPRRGRYLDLYYLPEAGRLTGANPAPVGRRQEASLRLGSDSYTAPTANDSKTVGSFAGGTPVSGSPDPAQPEIRQFMNTVNSRYNDGPATFSKDGSVVIFTRNNYNEGVFRRSREGINKLKLYTSTLVNGQWSKPRELPLNSDEFSTGHPALARGANGEPDQRLYFASDRPGGFGGTDLYVSNWVAGQWGPPVNLGPLVNSKGHELFPFADDEGNLYLASDGHGGLGGLENLYIQLGTDSQPTGSLVNLGAPFNSPADDFGVVTDGKRNWGYFSSNRVKGGADDDVFRFLRKQEVNPCRELTLAISDVDTKEPLAHAQVAADSPVSGNEQLTTDENGLVRICLTAQSDTRFSVSREGYAGTKIGYSTQDFSDTGASRLEITLAKLTTDVASTVTGTVLSQSGREPIANAVVTLTSECDGSQQTTTTDADGTYTFSTNPECSYRVEATKADMGSADGYSPKNSAQPVDLLMFAKGDIIRVENIYYSLNKATLRPEAAGELDKVVALMNKYPAMTIELRSHTDSRATAQYNRTLSTNRAKIAASYLVSKGIATRRVLANGYGESLLLNNCADGVNCSEEDHQQNRRTEIKIVRVE
ncbi:carboxypeptidase regulatory-like domain-containing protein [Spirosoma rigui]|uniref:carboxypeptidase regulatory-like domain-containing protein n=1 Tax=Spirosoma rigui TaxID=564064 RepID=UPI0009AF5CF7|nr:carboxypeptidase regulatory-like domain-containing protein [Spirosoma rigui]